MRSQNPFCWGAPLVLAAGCNDLHVCRPRSLVPLLDIVLDGLPFRQGVKAFPLKRGPVKEEFGAIGSQNESKTSLPDQLLDLACRHRPYSSPDVRPAPVA